MFYKNDEIEKIHSIELDCLKEIINICDSNGIEYFAMAGTVLGAVRHNGFIPWDDDIDIGMKREDYFRFLKIAEKALPSQYALQSPYNSKVTPYPYTKIRVKDTEFIEYCHRNIKMEQGIYIDVFPFDKVPQNEFLNALQYYLAQYAFFIYHLKHTPEIIKRKAKLFFIVVYCRAILHYIASLIPHRLQIAVIDCILNMFNSSNSQYLTCLMMPKRKLGLVTESELKPLAIKKFEEIDIKIPREYDTYLRRQYGNYMEFPPPEKRVGHRPYRLKLLDSK